MKIFVHDERKTVEVWLTNPEKSEPDIAKKLKPLYHAARQKKYTVAVYFSGNRDVYDDMRHLAMKHRMQMAQNDVLHQKQPTGAAYGISR